MMLYISDMDHAGKLKLGSYKQNASILLRFSDSVQCRQCCIFLVLVLYFSFGTYLDVNIKQLCSSSMYKHNL